MSFLAIKKKKSVSSPHSSREITNLSVEILKNYKSRIYKPKSHCLDLSAPEFQLVSIDSSILEKSNYIKLSKLQELRLDNNRLSSLNELTSLPHLKILYMGFNMFQTLDIYYNNLEELYLNNNRFEKIPKLGHLDKLKILDLSNNFITNVDVELLQIRKSICVLNLSNNKINFIGTIEIKKWIEILKNLESLKELYIEGNFFQEDYPHITKIIINELLDKLEKIDDILITDKIKMDFKTSRKYTINNIIKVKKEQFEEQKFVSKREIKLEKLNNLIELCSSNPIKSMQNITLLSYYVNIIMEDYEIWDDIFVSKDIETQIALNDQIDHFLQNCLVLIENQQNIQQTLLVLISTLSIIPHANFGSKCLRTLNDLMSSGDELNTLIKKTLEKNIIPIIEKPDLSRIPPPILTGLVLIIDSHQCPDILKGKLDYMAEWLKQILNQMQKNYQDRDIYDLHNDALALIAVVSKNNENAIALRNLNINAILTFMFKLCKDSQYCNRYISILRIIENSSRNDDETALLYIKTKDTKESLLKEIQYEIQLFIQSFKKFNNDLRDELAKDTDTVVKIKFQKFASLILAYGAIVHHNVYVYSELSSDWMISELAMIVTLVKVNPVLLSALCDMFNDLFTNHSISNDQEMAKHLIYLLQKLTPLLPYMGGKKYAILCEMGELYQNNTFVGKEPVERIHLTNKVIHTLFISIVNLITFFSDGASNNSSPLKDLCSGISKSLNQNKREYYLFNCLDIPSDEVRLSIVQCLLSIRNEEWDTEEVGHLVTMLGSYKNLGAGKTEEVLSGIFMILSKIAKDQKSKIGKDFASLFAENAISNCFDILARNMERNVKESVEETTEKTNLALSCVYFLKITSNIDFLRGYLQGNQVLNAMKRSIIAEEKYLDESFIPIEVEQTWSGRFLENLLQCTSGNEALMAYHMVSYRIISRMADVLQGKKEEEIIDLGRGYLKNDLREKTNDQFRNKIRNEFYIWEDNYNDEKVKKIMEKLDDSERENFIKQHSLFALQNGMERILMFLLGRTAANNAAVLEKQLVKEFDEKYFKNDYYKEVEIKATLFEKELENQEKLDEEKKKIATKTNNKLFIIKNGKEKLENAFQKQNFTNDFEEIMQDRYLLSAPISEISVKKLLKKKTNKSDSPEKRKEKEFEYELFAYPNEEISNDTLLRIKKNKRILLISAMLRCMYAALEYAPDELSRKNAVLQIKKNKILKLITQLCASTGWILGNIGSKYLKIVYYGLKLHISVQNEEKENLEIYELVSKAICDILQIIRKKIFTEDKIPLTIEDKMLVFESAKCACLITKQIPNIVWSQKEIENFGHKLNIDRSPQEKCVELCFNKLIPLHILKVFIDIISSEMKYSSGLNKDLVKDEMELRIREEIRLSILKIIGGYISKCKEQRYEILEQFSKAQIFEKKTLRQSFVQEILNEMGKSNYLTKMEDYLRNEGMLYTDLKERILFLDYCRIRLENSSNWDLYILVLTIKGLYVLSPPKQTCSVCPPENFCPNGPSLNFRIEFKRIRFLLDLEGEQRMALQYEDDKKKMFFYQNKAITFLIFFFNITSKKVFTNILEQFDAISRHIPYEELSISCIDPTIYKKNIISIWAVLNPSKKEINKDENNISNFNFDKFRLFLISEGKLYVFQEKSDDWFFFFQQEKEKVKGEDNKDSDEAQENFIDRNIKGMLDRIKQKNIIAKKANKKIFNDCNEYNFNSLKYVEFNQGNVPLVHLKFGKEILTILFACDFSREKFRMALIKCLDIESWKKGDFDKINDRKI